MLNANYIGSVALVKKTAYWNARGNKYIFYSRAYESTTACIPKICISIDKLLQQMVQILELIGRESKGATGAWNDITSVTEYGQSSFHLES